MGGAHRTAAVERSSGRVSCSALLGRVPSGKSIARENRGPEPHRASFESGKPDTAFKACERGRAWRTARLALEIGSAPAAAAVKVAAGRFRSGRAAMVGAQGHARRSAQIGTSLLDESSAMQAEAAISKPK